MGEHNDDWVAQLESELALVGPNLIDPHANVTTRAPRPAIRKQHIRQALPLDDLSSVKPAVDKTLGSRREKHWRFNVSTTTRL